jgi:hypothetical protein
MTLRLLTAFIVVAACNSHGGSSGTSASRATSGTAALADTDVELSDVKLSADFVKDANARIIERQHAVKAWGSIAVPDSGVCASAPTPPTARADGFGLGTSEAKKTMTIVTAAELTGAPDPSLPAGVAAELAKINAAGRGAGSNAWVQMDYTSDDFPFAPGPVATAFQLEVGKLAIGQTQKTQPEMLALLTGKELVLVVDAQRRSDVDDEAHTFTAGTMAGTALLWSYDDHRVICAGHFDVTNRSTEFQAGKAQVNRMPQEELELLAFRDAALHLHAVK